MSLIGEQVLLRAYLQSADRIPHTPTYERILHAAKQQHLAGATVLRGVLGAGYHGIVKQSAWTFAQHVPIIVEIVDSAEKITHFIHTTLDPLMIGGMLTLERAAVIMCRHRSQDQPNQLHLATALKPLCAMPRIETGSHMTINEHGVLLRVFIGESDTFDQKPLYEAIVLKVRELGLAGATVLRGSQGFGAHSVVHTSQLLAMSTDLPIVIEIVDAEQQIKLLLPHLETMVQEGMITMEYVMILMYRHGKSTDSSAGSFGPS